MPCRMRWRLAMRCNRKIGASSTRAVTHAAAMSACRRSQRSAGGQSKRQGFTGGAISNSCRLKAQSSAAFKDLTAKKCRLTCTGAPHRQISVRAGRKQTNLPVLESEGPPRLRHPRCCKPPGASGALLLAASTRLGVCHRCWPGTTTPMNCCPLGRCATSPVLVLNAGVDLIRHYRAAAAWHLSASRLSPCYRAKVAPRSPRLGALRA